MRITNFSVENFRSITKASELPLDDFSILIGPNNQGKSNILKALVLVLNFIESHTLYGRSYKKRIKNDYNLRRRRYRADDEDGRYAYDRDYPLNLQDKDPDKEGLSKFIMDFKLDLKEKSRFKRLTGKKLKDNLRIEASLGYRKPILDIKDTGKKINLSGRSKLSAYEFLSENLKITYIGAIRDSSRTLDIVEEMISDELSTLENNPKYKELIKKIAKMQKPLLVSLSEGLTKSVAEFLPETKKVYLDSEKGIGRIIRPSTIIHVDDGTDTPLELKGDGIKSLMAISSIEYATKQGEQRKNIILAIEEPESHLHPDAIHTLRHVLEKISTKNQVIISTHSPLLVNRTKIARNLIVNDSHAAVAKNVAEIREILGVKIADNLKSANLIIITEGKNDAEKLKRLLFQLSTNIENAHREGVIKFDPLEGADNLAGRVSMWDKMMCDVFVFLDGDESGIQAFQKATKNTFLSLHNTTFARLNGYKESELEDFILPRIYLEEVKKDGVDLSRSSEFKNSKRKWSTRMENAFKAQGKIWNNDIESLIKSKITKLVVEQGIDCVHKKNRQIFVIV